MRKMACGLKLPLGIFLMLAGASTHAMASSNFLPLNLAGVSEFFTPPFGSLEIMMLAIFGGAMSFALLSASWLIRERSRMSGENRHLKNRLADLRASHGRMDALVNITDQRIVVWNGAEEKPTVLGSVAVTSGAPEERSSFLAFGTWLNADSASNFEKALKDLRLNASSFDLPLQTNGGGVLEAQGRTSGGHAFVRFIELAAERAALAKLESEHAGLLASFDSVRQLLDAIAIPVWLKNQHGQLFWVNQAYATAVDAEDAEAAAKNDLQLFDSSERNEIAVAQKISNKYTGRLPAVVSGDRRILEVVDIVSQSGSAGIAIDRSDVESVNSTLQRTIASHAKMLDQLATAVAIFDSSRKLQFHNSSFQQMWDLKDPLLEGNPSQGDILDAMRSGGKLPEQPDWRKWREVQGEVYQALETIEDWWHLPNGTTLRVIKSPQEQGGASWTFENVTEQLALQSNYNALMKVQGETLDHLNEAVAVFGSDGKLKLSNPALERLWNPDNEDASNSQLKGKHVSEIFGELKKGVKNADVLDSIAVEITGFEDRRGDHSGRLELIDNTVLDFVVVPLPQGQSLLTFFDLTDSVNVERALQERTEALEEADHLKSKFIQHVSYELRAPLTNISGFGELLKAPATGSLNPKQAEYLDHINTSSDTLKAIVDDILDLATVDAGVMDLNLQTVDLDKSIDASLEGLRDLISQNDLSIKVDIAKNCNTLVADESRLLQIFYNLISNAVNFSPDGGRIDISATSTEDMVEISVSDMGPGVSEEISQSVFDRFESAGSDGRRQGTGLGLAIVESFVKLHGGTVHVERAPSGGAKFVCKIPRNPVQLLDAAE